MKTFIRRPGNKTKHLKHIIPLIPEFTGTYYEPFVGTGAVYLHLLPEKAILNDLNTDIINIWKLVKLNPEYIIQEIDKFKKSFLHLNNEDKLKMCKKIVLTINSLKGKEKTVNYFLMIYCSFNGTLFLNDKWYLGGLNGHIYKNESCHIFTKNYKQKLLELQKILKNIKIENKDYKLILKKCKKGDFVFLDPPYIEEKAYSFNYNKNEIFNPIELQEELEKLDKKGVKFMMTQIDTIQVRNLFKKYNFKNYINNSNFNNSKTTKKELVITNY
jgi:DNA adenine methylase